MSGEAPASERVIDEHRAAFGDEYRVQTEGEHPVERLRTENFHA